MRLRGMHHLKWKNAKSKMEKPHLIAKWLIRLQIITRLIKDLKNAMKTKTK